MIDSEHDSSTNNYVLFQFPSLMRGRPFNTKQQFKKNNKLSKSLFWSTDSLYNEMRFYKYLPGRIVFLIGTSSAGKSSIVKYIKENASISSEQLVFTGSDYIWNDLTIMRFLKKAPKEMLFLLNKITDPKKLIEYINELEKFVISEYHVNLDPEDIPKIRNMLLKLNNIRYTMEGMLWEWYQYCAARAIIPALARGKTIIIDTVELPSFLEMLNAPFHLIKCKTDTVVIYCPLKKLEQHIMQRNIASIENLIAGTRFFFPFEGYDEIYSTTENGDMAIDQIKLSELQEIDPSVKASYLREYIVKFLVQDPHPSRNKIRQNLLSEIDIIASESLTIQNSARQQFLINKWFSNGITITYIKPNISYQMAIHSGMLNPTECGEKLLTIVEPDIRSSKPNSLLPKCKIT